MALWDALKTIVDNVVKTNGNNEITGANLNSTLDQIIDNLGAFQFKGVAIPTTSPGAPDGTAWYIASQAGVYTNFGAAVLMAGQIGFFKWDGSTWNLEVLEGVTGETQYIKKYQNLASEEIVNTPAKSLLTQIVIKGKTGSPVISVGSSSGAEDISRAKSVSAGSFLVVTKGKMYETAQNIYLNISGGTVDVSLIFTTNILT